MSILLFLQKKIQISLLFLILIFLSPIANTNGLIISEFMASNSHTLQDEDGDWSDWIEIYNPSGVDVNLLNCSITDNDDSPDKWRFPGVIVSSNSYLVIFASGKDRKTEGGNLHTNFKLSASGEYLGLYQPDGVLAYSLGSSFPEQYGDISFGDFEGTLIYFATSTPGSAN